MEMDFIFKYFFPQVKPTKTMGAVLWMWSKVKEPNDWSMARFSDVTQINLHKSTAWIK